MSVNINLKQTSNEDRWLSIKSGDFAIIAGTNEHPIPEGLYRVFSVPTDDHSQWFITPMFGESFEDGMFPYMVCNPPPLIKQTVHRVHIEVEVNS